MDRSANRAQDAVNFVTGGCCEEFAYRKVVLGVGFIAIGLSIVSRVQELRGSASGWRINSPTDLISIGLLYWGMNSAVNLNCIKGVIAAPPRLIFCKF